MWSGFKQHIQSNLIIKNFQNLTETLSIPTNIGQQHQFNHN